MYTTNITITILNYDKDINTNLTYILIYSYQNLFSNKQQFENNLFREYFE